MNPNNNVYQYQAGGQNDGRKRLLVIAGLVIIVAAALTYFILSASGTDSKDKTDGNKNTNNSSGAEALSALGDFSFVSPSNMEGFRLDKNFVTGVSDYTTVNNGCNLQYGVVNSDDMPGIDEKSIIALNLGITGTGITPELGQNLVLKDTASSTKYAMPVYDAAYTKNNVNYKTKFAIVILPEFKRGFIRQYCSSSEGPVADADFKKLNNKAAEITVKRPAPKTTQQQ